MRKSPVEELLDFIDYDTEGLAPWWLEKLEWFGSDETENMFEQRYAEWQGWT